MNKKILVLTALTLIIFGCSNNNTSPATGFSIYQAEDYSFEIPENWVPAEIDNKYKGYIDETNTKLLTIREVPLEGLSFMDIVSSTRNSLLTSINNSRIASQESSIINGRRVIKINFLYEDQEKNQEFEHTLFILYDNKNNRALLLGLTTFRSEHNNTINILDNVVSTLKIN